MNKNNSNAEKKKNQVELLSKIFHKYDKDDSGLLNVDELKFALKDSGIQQNLTKDSIRDILTNKLSKSPTTDDQSLNYEDFKLLFDESRLLSIFNEIDIDQSGSITVNELSDAFDRLEIYLPENKLPIIFSKVDINLDGHITLEEFTEFFKLMPMADLRSIAESWSNLISNGGIDTGSDLIPSTSSTSTTTTIPLWQFVLAGGLGGIVSRTITAPLEVIKLRAQTSSSSNDYKGMIQEYQTCLKSNGIKGLFVGNLTNCIRIFPHAGIGCLAYSRFVKWLPSDSELDSMEFVWRAIAGAGAGATATLITYPLDTIRARLTVQSSTTQQQQQQHHYTGIIDAFRKIIRSEGIHGLYRGINPTLLAVAPFVAIQQATYDVVKQYTIENIGMKPSVSLFMSCGGVAAITAQSIVYPLDLIRRRMQTSTSTTIIGSSGATATTTTSSVAARGIFTESYLWLAVETIVKERGIKGLYRGIVPTFLKVMPAVAISVTVRDAALGRLS